MSDRIVVLRNLSVTLSQKKILDGISLELEKGGHLVILGQNGAGKSTLAKALNGFLPYEGEIELCGNALDCLSHRERARSISYIPPFLSSYDPAVSVREFVLAGRYAHQSRFELSTRDDQEKVERCLEELGVKSKADDSIEKLSSGEKHLVMLAQVLVQDSDIIVMDEPTANLDPINSTKLFGQLRALKHYKTIILITHDLALAHAFDSKLLYLESGKLRFLGDSEEFFDQKTLQEYYGDSVGVFHGKVLIRYGEDGL